METGWSGRHPELLLSVKLDGSGDNDGRDFIEGEFSISLHILWRASQGRNCFTESTMKKNKNLKLMKCKDKNVHWHQ